MLQYAKYVFYKVFMVLCNPEHLSCVSNMVYFVISMNILSNLLLITSLNDFVLLM